MHTPTAIDVLQGASKQMTTMLFEKIENPSFPMDGDLRAVVFATGRLYINSIKSIFAEEPNDIIFTLFYEYDSSYSTVSDDPFSLEPPEFWRIKRNDKGEPLVGFAMDTSSDPNFRAGIIESTSVTLNKLIAQRNLLDLQTSSGDFGTQAGLDEEDQREEEENDNGAE
jgi:hypothetical protein